jgi:hypothetical protein
VKKYKTSKVFVPGGMPQHTYVARSERNLENSLRLAADNLCKLVTVTGATKSGKTVLTNKVFPRTNNLWVDGGAIGEENDLWNYILEGSSGYTNLELEQAKESTSTIGGEIEGEAGLPFVAKAKGKIDAELSDSRRYTKIKGISLSPSSAAITQLRRVQKPLIIDDFHYLDRISKEM